MYLLAYSFIHMVGSQPIFAGAFRLHLQGEKEQQ
jgi:hypothetical protein